MLLGAWPHPRAKHWARGVSSGGFDEAVGGLPKSTICPKGDRLETNVKLFAFDDRMLLAIADRSSHALPLVCCVVFDRTCPSNLIALLTHCLSYVGGL